MTYSEAIAANTQALTPYNAAMDAGLTPTPQVVEDVLNSALDILASDPPDLLSRIIVTTLIETTELVAQRAYKYRVVIEDYRYSVTPIVEEN